MYVNYIVWPNMSKLFLLIFFSCGCLGDIPFTGNMSSLFLCVIRCWLFLLKLETNPGYSTPIRTYATSIDFIKVGGSLTQGSNSYV